MIAVAGKNVVVTGVIAGESRATAENRLRDAGAFVHPSVTSKVDVLVTGARVGATKINAAKKNGVVVVPWEQVAWDAASADGEVEESVAGPPALETFRQIGPMLAEPGPLPPSTPGWSFELKWDGYRCVATVKGGRVAMQSRSGKTEYKEQFPKIAAELALLPDCVIDGELVVLPAAAAVVETASQALQRGASAGSFKAIAGGNDAGGTAKFVVFDVLEVLGNDVRAEPLSRRREYLPELLKGRTLIGACPVFDDGEALFDYCVEHGLEGVVAKRNDSRYMDGARNAVWTKVKARCRQEFAVCGYTEGKGKRAGSAGALLLCVADEASGEYVYCGSVGTGGTYDDYKAIVDSLSPLQNRLTSARHDLSRAELGRTTWVDVEVVVEVEFQRWTEDGHLFHPSMQGVRNDKDPADVVREPCGKGGTS